MKHFIPPKSLDAHEQSMVDWLRGLRRKYIVQYANPNLWMDRRDNRHWARFYGNLLRKHGIRP